MTAQQFTEALEAIGWSKLRLARLLGCSDTVVWRWARGEAAVPPVIERWLNRLVLAHALCEVPDDWRQVK